MIRKKIVTVGGGTGSFTVLKGLKEYPLEVAAVVAMTDDGGSTGVLRDEIGALPPGDVRQCLVALSDSSGMLRKLMNYRFEEGRLCGHNFGNLFLSALEKITGNFASGLDEAMKILNVKGTVLPVVNQDLHLVAKGKNGNPLVGQDRINHSNLSSSDKIYFSSRAIANRQAIQKALDADVIVIGPGNHFCSVLPNIAVKGFARAIRNSQAKVIYVCNLTNKKGHNSGWNLENYVQSVESYIGKGRVDAVVFPSKKPSKKLLKKYEKQEGEQVLVKLDPQRKVGEYKIYLKDVVSNRQFKYSKADAVSDLRSLIRHDSDKLAKAIFEIMNIDDF